MDLLFLSLGAGHIQCMIYDMAKKMNRLTGVCEELDKVLIEVMSTLDELSILRKKYSDTVSEGYFYMSQARHAMGGPSAVSSLQYDTRMKALVSVESSIDSDVTFDELAKRLDKKLDMEFQVERKNPSKPVKKLNPDTKPESESQLRRRNVDKSSVEDVPLSKPTPETVVVGEAETTVVTDPIKWFGVLVPPYLRRSQDHFKQCVLLVAEMSSTQTKLETLRRKFRDLLQEKKELSNEAN